jgi:hypothetical protein
VRFLPPIDTTAWREEDLDQHIEEVRALMNQTYQELRAQLGLPPLEP